MSAILTIDNHLEGGLQNYTRHLMDIDQFFSQELNKPMFFTFAVQDLGLSDFVVPTRGGYVVFEDYRWDSRSEGVPDGVMFTGYITDEPEPVALGKAADGTVAWKYTIKCASEDYLLQIKNLPVKTYVNKRRGFIVRDIVATMFADIIPPPIDTLGVQDGGIERLYQTDQSKKFADMMAEFANADNYRYYCLHARLFYEPIAELLPAVSDPELKLVIDPEDPRYTPTSLQLQRVATSIINDVTVFGEEEPGMLVRERYISDGYQGEFQLLFKPYGVTEVVLVEDDFTAPQFDSGIWEENDDELALTGLGDGSYIQPFEGSLNVVGGPGEIDDAAYLRSRRGMELAGTIEFRDCELFFAPGSTGVGVIGGLYTSDNQHSDNLFAGWRVDLSGPVPGEIGSIWPYIHDSTTGSAVIIPEAGYGLHLDRHYVLRRTFEFDIPVGLPVVRRGPAGSLIEYGDVTRVNGCTVRYTIEEIDSTDPQNVITTKTEVWNSRLENAPEFVLYSPINSFTLHCVMNYCKVHRPQQVKLTVNGLPAPIGDFIDGGLATIGVDDARAKLQWYSFPTGVSAPPDLIVGAGTPFAQWKLGEAGSFVADTGATGTYSGVSDPGVTIVPGAPNSTTDQARHFPGVINPPGQPNPAVRQAAGSPFLAGGFPVPFSLSAWIRTSQANAAIFSYLGPMAGYVGFVISNGRVQGRIEAPEAAVTGVTPVNDGSWHHVGWVFTGTESRLYVDGVRDAVATQGFATPQINVPWAIGYDNAYWPSIGAFIETYMNGDIDEVGLYDVELSDDQMRSLFRVSQSPSGGGGLPPPSYNPQTGVTIPPQGSVIEIRYHRAEKSKARVRSTDSILREQARFGDDGVRQITLLPDDVFPVPRTSEECQYLAQAYLDDRVEARFEGSYTYETGERDITLHRLFPLPGDMIPVDVTLSSGERIDKNMVINRVSSTFIGDGAYAISFDFGPRNRFDEALRKLFLARASSLDNPEIKDNDILTAEIINNPTYEVPDDIANIVVAQVTPQTFTIDVNPSGEVLLSGYGSGGGTEVNYTLPTGVVGYEVRRDNTGWGQPNYVARVSTATITLNRGQRDRAYFVRPFNASNNYSRNSAIIRVIGPLSNTLTATGLDGDINGQSARLFIPVVRNPDIGGFLVQRDSIDGAILYVGDGVTHRSIVAGATVLVESNQITLTIPNTTAASTYTVSVQVYNLINEFGPAVTFVITRPTPTT